LAFFGDRYLHEITPEEIAQRWRPAEFNRPNLKHPDRKLSPVARQKRHGALRKFFEWARSLHGYPYANPMGANVATKREIAQARRPYKEFSNEDIARLFGANYRDAMNKPDWYFGPLIALYSGARLGEIADLELVTFEIIDGVKCAFVQKGKTPDSRRSVPIHQVLLDLGLWEYVEALKARGETHLFPHRPDDKRGKSLGRQWGLWVARCGIDDPAKTFHSFRATAITDMYNSPTANAEAIRRAAGHTSDTVRVADAHRGYIRGLVLERVKDSIDSLSYAGVEVEKLKLDDPTFSEFFANWKPSPSRKHRKRSKADDAVARSPKSTATD
jgi:integrase